MTYDAKIAALERRIAAIEGASKTSGDVTIIGAGYRGDVRLLFATRPPTSATGLPGLRIKGDAGDGSHASVMVGDGATWRSIFPVFNLTLAPTNGSNWYGTTFDVADSGGAPVGTLIESSILLVQRGLWQRPGSSYDFTYAAGVVTMANAPYLAGEDVTNAGNEVWIAAAWRQLS